MEGKHKEKVIHEAMVRMEITRRDLLKVAGISALVFGTGVLPVGCAGPPEDVLDALCDTFIPGEENAPGTGPGAIDGGMRYFLADIMGQENVDMILQVMAVISPDFHTLPYDERVAIMEIIRNIPELSDIFYGLQQATAFAFYSELMGQGPTPCGDADFPGTFAILGIPKFNEGASKDRFTCS